VSPALNVTVTAGNFGSLAGGGTLGGNVNLNNVGGSTLTIGSDHTSTTYSGVIGGTAPTIALRKIGTGTLSLTRASTLAGGTTAINGTLLLDYASVDPQGAGALTLSGGRLTFKGNVAGTTTDTVGTITTITNSRSGIAVENSAAITTGVWTSGGSANPVLVDLSNGASSKLIAPAFPTTDSASVSVIELGDIVMLGSTTAGAKRANLYVQDATGIGFATQNGSNEIVRYTGATDLTASGATTSTTNYKLSADLTRTGVLNFQTLDINTTGGAVTLSMGSNLFVASGSGRSILVTGNNDASITGSGNLTNSNLLNLANYGTGTTTLAMNLVTNALVKNGPGLVVYSGSTMNADAHVTEGTLRFSTPIDYTTGVVRIYGGGVFELGADLNGSTAGDFSKPVANATNGVAMVGDGGFSAHGADRTVNLGGAAAAVTWGSSFFLSDPAAGSVDNDYLFKLGSATSTHTLEFVNPIALGVRQRFVEVADGTSGTNVDGKLSGVLSGTGGLTKTGAGTLELTVANTYTGPTNVNAGTLIVTGSLAVTTADLTVADDATLSGTGSIGSDGVINGDLRIGANATNNSVGTLTFTDAGATAPGVSFGSTATWLVDLVQGTNNSDRLAVEGLLAIAPGASLSFNVDTTAPFSTSSFYTIAAYGGNRTGMFSGISEGQTLLLGGGAYIFSYGTGSSSAITLTAVPEPGTLGLLGMGIVGFAIRRYRKKQADCG
jgi:fibronectin-binding autotransporter adhesin